MAAPAAQGEAGGVAPVKISKHLLVRAGGRFYAVPILGVREVLPRQEYVRLPGADAAVCGLVSVRSRVLTVLDLAAALGVGESSALPEHRVVVLEDGERSAGLAVDAVGEIVELGSEAVAQKDEAVARDGQERRYLVGVAETEGVRCGLLNVAALLDEWFG